MPLEREAALVLADKGLFRKHLRGVSLEELHIQYELLALKMPKLKE